jgi:hypothetical protein
MEDSASTSSEEVKRIEILENDLSRFKQRDFENRKIIAKMFENNEKIITSLLYKNQEFDKKLSLLNNFIEHICEPESDITEFLSKNLIDIYICNRNLFCKMIAKQEQLTMNCVIVFKLLFFDVSYQELDLILEDASKHINVLPSYYKWYKLNFLYNLVLQGYTLTNDLAGFPHKLQTDEKDKMRKLDNENHKNIFLQKMYKIFEDTDVSSCPPPYNTKEHFLKSTIFKICYHEAENM